MAGIGLLGLTCICSGLAWAIYEQASGPTYFLAAGVAILGLGTFFAWIEL